MNNVTGNGITKIKHIISIEYVAGFLDGEGTVLLRKDKHGWFGLSVQISNTHEGVLQRIASTFGGAVCPKNSQHLKINNLRAQFTWYMFGQPALPVLRQIFPCLIVKREHVELAIEFLEHLSPGSGNQLTDKKRERRQEIYKRFKELNKRGKR